LPPPVEPVQLLALLTRVRAQRVEAGELAPGRLYDVRAFKCCVAELGYLRRLAAAGRVGGTVVTSMRQLVAGLAALHPAWRIDGGEGWEDRDRHHRTVRRRLDALQAMGLLRWRIGTDPDGEERRTELELQPAPDVSAEELQAAARCLERWQARYGPALNTGSKTGIRNAAGHGRPLNASERQRRGCQRARAAAASRQCRDGYQSNSNPPFGAPATPENNTAVTANLSELPNACHRTGVTRANAPAASSDSTALETPKTAGGEDREVVAGEPPESLKGAVSSSQRAGGSEWNPEAIVARVMARQAQRRPVLEAIAGQAQARALELAGWGLARSWPFGRLREAWVVARWGAIAAADSGPSAAGPLYPDDYARLRRAVARYQRNQSAAPAGYPAGGLAALLHLGALAGAGELAGGPRTLRYAVGALDQLSRRMRATATADSAKHAEHASQRAHRRRQPTPRALALSFRATWPPWVATDEHQNPIFDRLGMLALDHDARGGVPPVDSDQYRMIVRDAYLLAGRQLPVDVDARKQMALRHQDKLPPAARRPAPSEPQRELAELAHHTGQPISQLGRLTPAYRQAWLARLRCEDARRAWREIIAFKDQIANITTDVDRR
jgi:hypothetical protein